MVSTESNVIAELAARQQIVESLYSYCRALDRMDRPLADSVWHPGGTADYGPGYRGSATGFLDFVWAYHLRLESHSHMVSNTIISVDLNSGTAKSESYVAVWLRSAPSGGTVTDVFHRGRYVDRWSLREDLWAIDHRIYVADLMHETSNQAGPETWGRRDTTDPSYQVLG